MTGSPCGSLKNVASNDGVDEFVSDVPCTDVDTDRTQSTMLRVIRRVTMAARYVELSIITMG